MPKVGMEPIRRKQLIEAVIECIGMFGYNKTTVQKISKQAKVSTGVLHHYFANKDALIEEAQKYMLSSLKQAYLEAITGAVTPLQRLHAIVDATLLGEQSSSRGYGIWLSFWSECMYSPKLARLEEISQRRHHSNLVYTLKQILPKEEAVKQAHIINALMNGLWLGNAIGSKSKILPINQMVYDYIDTLFERHAINSVPLKLHCS